MVRTGREAATFCSVRPAGAGHLRLKRSDSENQALIRGPVKILVKRYFGAFGLRPGQATAGQRDRAASLTWAAALLWPGRGSEPRSVFGPGIFRRDDIFAG